MDEWMGNGHNRTGSLSLHHLLQSQRSNRRPQERRADNHFSPAYQHVLLNFHLNRIQPKIPPSCPLCQNPYETVKNFLFDCPPLADLRRNTSKHLQTLRNVYIQQHNNCCKSANTTPWHLVEWRRLRWLLDQESKVYYRLCLCFEGQWMQLR